MNKTAEKAATSVRTTKISRFQPEIGRKSLRINKLSSIDTTLTPRPPRLIPPSVQSVVPISRFPRVGAPLVREGSRTGAIVVWAIGLLGGVTIGRCSKV